MNEHTDLFDHVYSLYLDLKPDNWFAPAEDYAEISPKVGELAQAAVEAVLHLKFELADVCDKELQLAKKDGEQWAKNWRACR